MDLALLTARLVLAVVFALAAITKLLDRAGSRQAVADFGVPHAWADAVSLALPFAESAVVVALLAVGWSRWGALGALLLLLLFIAGIGINLARGQTPDCHCFGQLYSEPIGMQTIIRNVVLGFIAVFVLIAGYGHPGVDVFSRFRSLTGVEQLAIGLGVIALLAAAAQWWLLLHPPLWLVDRLPMLGGASVVETPTRPRDVTATHSENSAESGLPVGSPAPRFRLPGLYGETMTLDALRAGGRAVILVFVSPSCAPCSALMPDIARWQIEYAGALRFVLISSGTLEDNRAKAQDHGIVEILLQKAFEVGSAYQISGTPGALIVRPDGTIGSPVAEGADRIRALLDQYVELLAAEVGIELEDEGELARALHQAANPLGLGTPAPDLEFLEAAGTTVSLSEFRGRDIALLFWRTTCSFCQQMEPVLQAWEEDRPDNAPDLLIVLGEPLADGETVHVQSPVLIDRESAAARAFHSNGTPTAVLIDAHGDIASQPAVGLNAIRPLLRLGPAPVPESPPIPLLAQAPLRPVMKTPPASDDSGLVTPARDVAFTDLRGETLRLSELRGRDTILLFWSSADDACRRIEPTLETWEQNLSDGDPDLVVLVSGSTSGNQVVNFGSRVVIDRDGAAAQAFGVSSAPTAVLVDAGGNIAAEPAVGAPQVLHLLRRTSRNMAEARA